MALIGLSNLVYAPLTKDDVTGITYGTIKSIAGAINAKIVPKTNSETMYADNIPFETASSLGEITVELETADLPLDIQADLLGATVAAGVLTNKALDNAPYVAIGFKALKSNGKYRYIWLYKGKFELPDMESSTKEDKPKFQTPKIKGTFIPRQNDNAWRAVADEDATGYVATTGTNWFKSVYPLPAS